MRATLIVVTCSLLLAGCGGGDVRSTGSGVATYSGSHAPTAQAPTPQITTSSRTPAAVLACKTAPQQIIATINAAFTDGEHLEHAQAVDGPQAMTYVGGNIFTAAGVKESSQDTWVLSADQVYALTSDARRHTALPDGRQLGAGDWMQYNDAVGECVGTVERAENQGG